MDSKTFETDPRTQAETVSGTGHHTISLTGELTGTGVEIPDTNPVAQTRATIVHEIAHTFPGNLFIAYGHKFSETGKVPHHVEPPPTEYATTNYTEDFCESFMLFTLYPGTLEQKCPQRFGYFKWLSGGLEILLERALDTAEEGLAAGAAPAGSTA